MHRSKSHSFSITSSARVTSDAGTVEMGNAPSILGYLARVAALAGFSFESVGPIQSLFSVAAHSLGREKHRLNEIGAASYRSNV
jgi:hypothetical protein